MWLKKQVKITLGVMIIMNVSLNSWVAGDPPQTLVNREIVLVELGRHGFIPSTIETKTSKSFEIYLRVVTGEDQPLSLQWMASEGREVRRQTYTTKQRRVVMPVNLPVGSYLIKEMNHSKWVLRVNVK